MVVLLWNLLHKEQLATWVAVCLDDIKVDGHGPLGARWVNYSAYALYFQLRLLYAIINRLRKEICCCQQTGGKSSLSSWSSLLCLEHPPFLKSCWRHMLLSRGSPVSLTSETRNASSLPTSQCPILMAICLLNVLVNVLLLHKAFLQRSHEFNL